MKELGVEFKKSYESYMYMIGNKWEKEKIDTTYYQTKIKQTTKNKDLYIDVKLIKILILLVRYWNFIRGLYKGIFSKYRNWKNEKVL